MTEAEAPAAEEIRVITVRVAADCPFEARGPAVVLRLEKEAEKSEGGIHIPEHAREVMTVATVVAVGDQVIQLDIGDRVPFGRYAGHDHERDGRIYKFVHEGELPVRERKVTA